MVSRGDREILLIRKASLLTYSSTASSSSSNMLLLNRSQESAVILFSRHRLSHFLTRTSSPTHPPPPRFFSKADFGLSLSNTRRRDPQTLIPLVLSDAARLFALSKRWLNKLSNPAATFTSQSSALLLLLPSPLDATTTHHQKP